MKKRIVPISNCYVSCAASVVGKHESLGPMGDSFDFTHPTKNPNIKIIPKLKTIF